MRSRRQASFVRESCMDGICQEPRERHLRRKRRSLLQELAGVLRICDNKEPQLKASARVPPLAPLKNVLFRNMCVGCAAPGSLWEVIMRLCSTLLGCWHTVAIPSSFEGLLVRSSSCLALSIHLLGGLGGGDFFGTLVSRLIFGVSRVTVWVIPTRWMSPRATQCM